MGGGAHIGLYSSFITFRRQTQSTVSKLEQGQQRLLNYTRTLEDCCLALDVSIRKRHLILTGITEDPTEEPGSAEELDNENNANATHKIALNTLLAIHDTLVYDDIGCAYRMGKKSAKARPILIKFCKESIRDVISKKKETSKRCGGDQICLFK